jgi:hypothetical protein
LGCAARSGPSSYRLVSNADKRVLIPPGVKDAGAKRRVIDFPTLADARPCSGSEGGIELIPRRKGLRLAVDGDILEQQPAGWLALFAVSLEERGCLPSGEGLRLATQVAQSVPLLLRAEQRLLNHDARASGFTDLMPGYRLRVVSPVFREGAARDARTTVGQGTVEESPGGLTVTVQTSPDLIGYEMAWYAVEPLPQGGSRIVPRYADFHREGDLTRQPAPRVNHLDFDPEMAYFRMLFMARRMTSSNDHDIFLVAAPTQPLLEERTRELEIDASVCKPSATFSSADRGATGGSQSASRGSALPYPNATRTTCTIAPRQVAVVAFIPVQVQGKEVLVHPGATLANALREAGAEVGQVLPTLVVSKPYGGDLAPVKALGEKTDLLRLPLSGGEQIRW